MRRWHRSRRYGRRNPRNAPWGSFEAEYRQAGTQNPRRRATSKRVGNSGMYIGKLDDLVVEGSGGHGRKVNTKGLHLAWIPSRNNFAIVKPSRAKPGQIDQSTRDVHAKFHAAAPSKAVAYNWPDQVGSLREVGLIRSLTYVVPTSVRSPTKHGCRWVHAFGDHGEEGHGPMRGGVKVYPDTLKPMLLADEAGNLFVRRRPGNKYTVTDWIFW